jgi:putative oxidoreductase
MLLMNNIGDVGLLLLRIALGIIFIYHAMPKLKGKMGAFMLFIGIAEILGGIAVLCGFLTEPAAIGIAVIMLGAIYKKIFEWKTPFSSMEKTGWEYDMILLAAALALLFTGAGNYSVDALLGWWP